MKLITGVSTLLFLGACTHSTHLVHTSDFSPTYKSYTNGEVVKARSEQNVILGFIGNTNYVDDAYNKLQASCTNGEIQGITTQYATSHGFLSWTNAIEMKGLCVR
jgi:D-alanyl-D-alanine carboxypeptidase